MYLLLLALLLLVSAFAQVTGGVFSPDVREGHRSSQYRAALDPEDGRLAGQGRVVYRYKQPFRDGSTHVVLEPLWFSPVFTDTQLSSI